MPENGGLECAEAKIQTVLSAEPESTPSSRVFRCADRKRSARTQTCTGIWSGAGRSRGGHANNARGGEGRRSNWQPCNLSRGTPHPVIVV